MRQHSRWLSIYHAAHYSYPTYARDAFRDGHQVVAPITFFGILVGKRHHLMDLLRDGLLKRRERISVWLSALRRSIKNVAKPGEGSFHVRNLLHFSVA